MSEHFSSVTPAHRRHDISDSVWLLLAPHLPGRAGQWGGIARDNRLFINAVFWILRTGAPWRDLPPDYGDWKNTHRRFCRWRDKEVWSTLLAQLITDPDFEWLMIGCHSHQGSSACGRGAGRQSSDGRHKRGLNSKLHLAVDAHGMPVRLLLTNGTAADCSLAAALIKDLKAEHLLTDRGTTAMPLLNKPSSKACSHKFRREKTASNPATMT